MGNEYMTINKTPGAEKKNWCLVLKAAKPVKQAGVKIGDKTYQYASNYEIDKNDVAVIGAKNQPKTQGEMGIVESTLDKLEIKKNYAADLAFVFTDKADKKMIAACKKYIANDNDKPDADGTNLYPVTFKVRKLLAACCIVAFPQLASKDDLKNAKEYIDDKQILDDIRSASYNSFELCDYYGDGSPGISDGWLSPDDYDDMSNAEQKEIDDEFNRRVFCDTVAIMLRGGFVNLLEALLSVDPPIGSFYKDIVKSIGNAYNPTAMKVLKAYDPSKGWKACESNIRSIAGEREEILKVPKVASKSKTAPEKIKEPATKYKDIKEFIKRQMIPSPYSVINPAYAEVYRKKQEEADRVRAEYIGFVDTTHKVSFASKTFAFDASINTGKLSDKLADKGGEISKNINGNIDYFIVYTGGKELYTVKAGWQKVVDYNKKGKSIKIIDLKDFLEALL